MAVELTRLDSDVMARASKISSALRQCGTMGLWSRAQVLKLAASPGLAQLELALGLRSPDPGEKLDPYWARFKP